MSAVDVAGVTVPHVDSVFVGGEWIPADGPVHDVVSPATEESVAQVVLPSSEQAGAALRAADEGRAWGRVPVGTRVEICARFCAALEARFAEMGTVWAAEAGMPIRYSATLHKFGAAGAWSAALECAVDALRDDTRKSMLGEVLVRREPAGVVLAIMAYNGPLVTMGTKVIPALLAGCPVIVKAAVESQLIMRLVADCAVGAGFPPGALSILCGDVTIGRQLTADPRVDMVSLTGGRVAAQQIIEATRPRLARTHLELGGKSPALILDDAPLDRVLKTLVPGATGGTGQVCAALSRVLISERRHDELIEAMRSAWQRLRIGDPLNGETRIGPLVNEAARRRTEEFVDRALGAGGRVVTGGRRPRHTGTGWYYEPTVITGLPPDADLVRNEVFGPVTVVQTYRDLDEGVWLANDTSFGLAASVYTADRAAALDVASRIRSGSVAVNTFGPAVSAPFGGVKGSGWGRESGPEGIAEFTELKQIVIGPGV
ncbi:acyl-CoA reductase-like NAD-dependent aldehyde dehydrogenase [Nocardia kruczakiae]|uniref:Acyl-CoA reductase-like NAD-dependent aldehyde dehydrogenase n=1 Tax=Nocardia kruczakiae TaxID=261477 RepID=A0ABU1X8Z9_9NOCA|nr:aldehyde dehydrogenase family protein [Nocardia kruczakiae]MDR7166944.1 acyl-CoA reductase-like NAD-dependent aldehyde dehydrogenase [Nocardia kruczakiae]